LTILFGIKYTTDELMKILDEFEDHISGAMAVFKQRPRKG
jgi:hypothetical protein